MSNASSVHSRSRSDDATLNKDANGNLTADGTNTYSWDAQNHLTAVSGGATASFVYDGFGPRISKTINSTTTQFLYDRLNPVQELNAGNQVSANLLTGLRVDEYFTRTDTATSTFLADALGSTIGLVGSSQTIATSYTYQPFGAATVSSCTFFAASGQVASGCLLSTACCGSCSTDCGRAVWK